MDKKFGVLTFPATPYYNVGDYIQSLAAMQYLPHVDVWINREKLKSYSGDGVNMIMNSWYMYNPAEFPPSDQINPLFVAFHLNASVKDILLKDKITLDYFRKYGEIGCRDMYTCNSLMDAGLNAYFSGCLTTTLDIKYKYDGKREGIILADPLYSLPNLDTLSYSFRHFAKGLIKGDILRLGLRKKILKSLIDKDILDNSLFLHHKLPGSHSEKRRFEEAEKFVNYFAKAKLVITSRIHCALPCLALKTPVIFINYGFFNRSDQSRFQGLLDLFNTINIDNEGNIHSNFGFKKGDLISGKTEINNPSLYMEYAKKLKEKCYNFVNQ